MRIPRKGTSRTGTHVPMMGHSALISSRPSSVKSLVLTNCEVSVPAFTVIPHMPYARFMRDIGGSVEDSESFSTISAAIAAWTVSNRVVPTTPVASPAVYSGFIW